MKKYIFITVLILFFFSQKSLCQPFYCVPAIEENGHPPDSLTLYLTTIDLTAFVGMPVDSFLVKLPNNYDSMRVYGGHNPKRAGKLIISYINKNISVFIYVSTFKYMDPWSNYTTWDITLFRKENIDHIIVYKGSDCINGCLL